MTELSFFNPLKFSNVHVVFYLITVGLHAQRESAFEHLFFWILFQDVCGKTKASGTGLVYIDAFTHFHCLWDAR